MQQMLDLGVSATAQDLNWEVLSAMGYSLRPNEIIIDSFAGAGGMSCAIEAALGRSPDVAINHDESAILTHETNHPTTKHYHASVYAIDPRDAVPPGKTVGLFWCSPDCRSFSRARGSAPKSKSVRDLAWTVVHYAEMVRPRVIGVENVAEITKWAPLGMDGQAKPGTEGETFEKWCAALRKLGYALEWRLLNAADYGAPTTRVRLFVQARCDGLPIVWPEPTHGKPGDPAVINGQKLPWRTAMECINFQLPVNSIFLTKEEAKIAGCKRPLADKTLRRIARGMFRHVINADEPFVLSYWGEKKETEGFRGSAMDEPFGTQTTANRFGLVVPLTHQGDDRVYGLGDPFRTITGANRGESAFVAPTLIQTGYGERPGQKPRSLDLNAPLGTAVAGGQKHAVAAAYMTCMNQNAAGSSPGDPLKTVMAGATRHVYVEGALQGAVDRRQEVADFLWEYRHLSEKEVTRDELGVVRVAGRPLEIMDIGLRMLSAPELARAQGFPADFRADLRADGKVNTSETQVRLIGNAVPPPMGAAVIRAMFGVEQEELALAA